MAVVSDTQLRGVAEGYSTVVRSTYHAVYAMGERSERREALIERPAVHHHQTEALDLRGHEQHLAHEGRAAEGQDHVVVPDRRDHVLGDVLRSIHNALLQESLQLLEENVLGFCFGYFGRYLRDGETHELDQVAHTSTKLPTLHKILNLTTTKHIVQQRV